MPESAPAKSFIHLHVHSAYSLSEGAIKAEKLPALARDAGMPAVAITDTANLFGALEFAQACAAKGVQPIMGCQLHLTRAASDERPEAERLPPDPIVALAMDARGLDNLQRLSSLGFLRTDGSSRPCLKFEDAGRARGEPYPAYRWHPRPARPAVGGGGGGSLRPGCWLGCTRRSTTAW